MPSLFTANQKICFKHTTGPSSIKGDGVQPLHLKLDLGLPPSLSSLSVWKLISDLDYVFCGQKCALLKNRNREIHAVQEYDVFIFGQ